MTSTSDSVIGRNAKSTWVAAILVVLVSLTAVGAIVGSASESPTLVLTATLALWFLAVTWSALLAPGGYVLCAFLISFFVFLLARPTIVLIFGGDPHALSGLFGTNFWSLPLISDIFTLLYVTLAGLLVGGLVVNGLRNGKSVLDAKSSLTARGRINKSVRTWSLIIFFISAPFRVLTLLERGAAASSGDFYDLRVASMSSLPGGVHLVAGMADVMFFAFLATRPTKRETIIPILTFLAIGVISLGTWQRAEFVLSTIFVILYLIHRQHTDVTGERWISRRMVLGGALLLIPIVALLQFLGEIRGRTSASTSYPLFGLLDFLYSQGVTVNVIGYSLALEDRIPENKFYSLGPAIEFIKWNVGSIFTGAGYPTGQSVERAADGHQFSHLISYLVMPEMYLQGSGYGSSFVAELWIDAGLPGLIAGSFALGAALMLLPRLLLSRSVVLNTLALMVLCEIMFTPRANFIGYLVSPLGTSSLIGAALLSLAVLLTTRRGRNAIPSYSSPSRTLTRVRRRTR